MKIWDLAIAAKIEHLFPYGGGIKNMSPLQKGQNLTFEECKIVAQEYLIELFKYCIEKEARGTARITTEMG